jgi:ribosomal protein S18 acetylase RimI-like enzyme
MGGPPGRISYFKRFKMEAELASVAPPALPQGYFFLPWEPALLDVHAQVLYLSFLEEIDAVVFPSLGHQQGCRVLMTEICRKPGFLPEATWLLADGSGPVATVQGLRDRSGLGAIQNLGVVAAHRGRGLGAALLLQALQGFRQAGLARSLLEVTAQNDGAVRLYHRLGFRRRKTVYKAVERKDRTNVECGMRNAE